LWRKKNIRSKLSPLLTNLFKLTLPNQAETNEIPFGIATVSVDIIDINNK